jgi:hypothetical protein
MIAPHNLSQTPSKPAADGNDYAEHLRRQRFFQQDTRPTASVDAPLTSILVPSDNSEELEPLVCRMD